MFSFFIILFEQNIKIMFLEKFEESGNTNKRKFLFRTTPIENCFVFAD